MTKSLAIFFAGLLGGCVAAPNYEESLAQFSVHLNICTKQFGYDPDRVAALAPYELGNNEREWRSCAYEGIEKFLIPQSPIPAQYRLLISEDQEMTRQVGLKKATRAARKAMLDERLALIEKIERRDIEKNAAALHRRLRQTDKRHIGIIHLTR